MMVSMCWIYESSTALFTTRARGGLTSFDDLTRSKSVSIHKASTFPCSSHILNKASSVECEINMEISNLVSPAGSLRAEHLYPMLAGLIQHQ